MTTIRPDLKTVSISLSNEKEEEFSNPLDLSDILNICRQYHQLGHHIQNQIEIILDLGIEEAIKKSAVQKSSLPFIKSFLLAIHNNAYFGDASSQAFDCIELIQQYQETHCSVSIFN
jgi:hypothetical protein